MLAPTPEVIVNPEQASNRINVLGVRAMNTRRPMTQIKNLLVADNAKNFDSGGSLFGGWAPAAPGTPGQLMVRTGATSKEIRKKTGPATKALKYRASAGLSSTVGQTNPGEAYGEKDVFYSRFHQSGTKARYGKNGAYKGTLPKRELVGITDATRIKSVEIIRQFIVSE